jgi:hypothetical protein
MEMLMNEYMQGDRQRRDARPATRGHIKAGTGWYIPVSIAYQYHTFPVFSVFISEYYDMPTCLYIAASLKADG